jgi:hypothetical protein
MRRPHRIADPVRRFEANVMPLTECGCWAWLGTLYWTGHGMLSLRGKVTGAHRFSWALHRGPIPPGKSVLHHCDVACCVNPDHLYLGTQADNIRDRNARKRSAVGERVGSSKLTECDVREILKSSEPQRVLAQRFQVSTSTIRGVRSGKWWRRVFREVCGAGTSFAAHPQRVRGAG